MIKKYELILIITFLCIGISGIGLKLVLPLPFFSLLINLGFIISYILGLIVILRNSTLTKTKYWKIILFMFVFMLVGALFKIQHYPGSRYLLLTGMTGISITYLIRFLRKKSKNNLDIFKLVWVIITFSGYSIFIFIWIPNIISQISIGVFWLLFYYFYIDSKNNSEQYPIDYSQIK